MTMPIRVIVADDHPLIRTGIQMVLANETDIQVVGEAGTGVEVLEVVRRTEADVLLLDFSMPGTNTLEVVEAVQTLAPTLKIMMVSAYDDEVIIQSVIHAGVVGYLLKDDAEAMLGTGIRTVSRGATWFSGSVMQSLLATSSPTTSALIDTLSAQERQILQLLAQGCSNREIAQKLHLAEQTVRNYTSRIYDKLGVSSRSEALIWAFKHGLVTP